MGQLDEPKFEALVGAGCTACGHKTVEISTFIDRSLQIMLADPNGPGKWAHDGEKFVDGTYRISCASCKTVVWSDPCCPRCNATGGLAKAVAEESRLAIPKRCPECNELELLAIALVPATANYGAGVTPKPQATAEFGEAGYHVVAFACENCDHAVVTQKCPLCDAPGPLRPRP